MARRLGRVAAHVLARGPADAPGGRVAAERAAATHRTDAGTADGESSSRLGFGLDTDGKAEFFRRNGYVGVESALVGEELRRVQVAFTRAQDRERPRWQAGCRAGVGAQ